MSPVDSSEDEGEDVEMTEEDKKFIEDRDDSQGEVDGEDEEEEIRHKKRKRRAIVVEDEDGDLDDEDMDLLNENLGLKKETR
jgi:transcription elongation factor SPT6